MLDPYASARVSIAANPKSQGSLLQNPMRLGRLCLSRYEIRLRKILCTCKISTKHCIKHPKTREPWPLNEHRTFEHELKLGDSRRTGIPRGSGHEFPADPYQTRLQEEYAKQAHRKSGAVEGRADGILAWHLPLPLLM